MHHPHLDAPIARKSLVVLAAMYALLGWMVYARLTGGDACLATLTPECWEAVTAPR